MGIYSAVHRIRWEISRANRCYSQEGEERVLERLFKNTKNGFYVDCGANHPIRYSNTYRFYLKGWKGLVIDALPGTEKIYKHIRPRDIVVESGLGGGKSEKLIYYSFKESALNTFDETIAQERIKNEASKLLGKQIIPVRTLSNILEEYIKPGQQIEFFDVDIEGMDFEVLNSNDWEKYHPKAVCAEVGGKLSIMEIQAGTIGKLMADKGYILISRLWNTAIFADKGFCKYIR